MPARGSATAGSRPSIVLLVLRYRSRCCRPPRAPTRELGHEDHIDLTDLSHGQDLLALGAVVLGAGGGFLRRAYNLLAGFSCEGLQVPLLARTGLISGRDTAIDGGGLSQLNPLDVTGRKSAICAAFLRQSVSLNKLNFNRDTMPHREVLNAAAREGRTI